MSWQGQRALVRFLVKSVVAAVPAVAAGVALGGPWAGAGALAGCLAAGAYAYSYVGSHLARAGREKAYDPAVARQATVRMLLLAAAGAGFWLVGRRAVMGYLASFAVVFAALILSEIPRLTRLVSGGLER